MSTVAADSHSRTHSLLHHHDVDYSHQALVVSPSSARSDLTISVSMKETSTSPSSTSAGHDRVVSKEADLFDQNTLLPYVYCFIKNFVG